MTKNMVKMKAFAVEKALTKEIDLKVNKILINRSNV